MFLLFQISQKISGVGDAAVHHAGGNGGRAGEVHQSLGGAHAAREVSVGAGDADLTRSEDALMCAEAGTAAGGGDGSTGIHQILNVAGLHALLHDLVGSGNDDQTGILGDVSALQDLGSDGDVFQIGRAHV